MLAEVHNKLNEYQAGFCIGYSTADNIFNLYNIVQSNETKIYCYFVDLKSACDSINRESLNVQIIT